MAINVFQLNVAALSKANVAYKVYQTMFRVVKESETVDSRQNCFLLQNSSHEPKYLSVETRQELLRIENSWNTAIVTSVIKLGVSKGESRRKGIINKLILSSSERRLE